jgi:hypothetical protein
MINRSLHDRGTIETRLVQWAESTSSGRVLKKLGCCVLRTSEPLPAGKDHVQSNLFGSHQPSSDP